MSGTFDTFVGLYVSLDATTSTDERVRLMEEFLGSVSDGDAAWAVLLLSGRRRRRYLSSRALRDIARPLTGLPGWLFAECYAHVGDSAETIALLTAGTATDEICPEAGRNNASIREASLQYVMEDLVPAVAAAEEENRRKMLAELWHAHDETAVLVLNKVVTGGFRIGVSEKLVIRALAGAAGIDASILSRRMTGYREASAEAYRALISRESSDLDAGAAYPFYLASPLSDPSGLPGTLSDWLFEWKWDGIRLQIIVRNGVVTLWSRGEETINTSFPDLVDVARGLPDGTVIDCELLARRTKEQEADVADKQDRPAPFSSLQRRLGRKRVTQAILRDYPVYVSAYDLLELDGVDLRAEPIEKRRGLLQQVREHPAVADVVRFSPEVAVNTLEELEELRRTARDRGVEGLMVKRRGSVYRSGRTRGEWWKYKADPFTLDGVLIYAQAGSGKRANLFTDYTFGLRGPDGLVPFAKAYSGLDNREIARLDRWIRQNTVERYGPARAVRPELVFEIAFEGISPSTRHKSGIAVRFPRILRPRDDKSPEEADSLEDAWRLMERYNR